MKEGEKGEGGREGGRREIETAVRQGEGGREGGRRERRGKERDRDSSTAG